MGNMKINEDVLAVLAESKTDGNKLFLPQGQLERSLYVSVNKVIESIGGKWNRKERAHIFDCDISDAIEDAISTGEYTDEKKEYQFFETPFELAKKIVSMAGIRPGESVLEPSAGKGAIAKMVKGCDCVELNDANYKYLTENGFNVVGKDFLSFDRRYDVIVANPPFSRQQDVDHITHMIELAKRKVVTVASSAVCFRENKKTVEFRRLIQAMDGEIIRLPEKSFSSSGTNVNAVIVDVDINGKG